MPCRPRRGSSCQRHSYPKNMPTLRRGQRGRARAAIGYAIAEGATILKRSGFGPEGEHANPHEGPSHATLGSICGTATRRSPSIAGHPGHGHGALLRPIDDNVDRPENEDQDCSDPRDGTFACVACSLASLLRRDPRSKRSFHYNGDESRCREDGVARLASRTHNAARLLHVIPIDVFIVAAVWVALDASARDPHVVDPPADCDVSLS
jgi:hypothetical protein